MANLFITIEDIKARQILDSRGVPTVECDVMLSNGTIATSSVPSGASTGTREAIELRDNIDNYYFSKSVNKAIENINNIITPKLKGLNPYNQTKIDEILIEIDGTSNFSKLGSNASLAVSSAIVCASAKSKKQHLFRYVGGISANTIPTPMMNVINGGKHANNNLDIQEFMIVPYKFESFKDKLRAGAETFNKLKNILNYEGYSTNVGDEGGFAPNIKNSAEAMDLIVAAINQAGYKGEIFIALDVASSEFYSSGYYDLKGEQKVLSNDEMIEYLYNFTENYPIISIEDGLDENDFEGWKKLNIKFKDKCTLLVGDDLFTTNPKSLKVGMENNMANSILIKPNQIGTISQTIECVLNAKEYGYSPIMSHRSGETCSTLISDLAVGLNCPFIKAGSLSRGERLAKYNRLLKIEEIIKGK